MGFEIAKQKSQLCFNNACVPVQTGTFWPLEQDPCLHRGTALKKAPRACKTRGAFCVSD